MQRIPALRVALKDRPKSFQYIIFFLVSFSLVNLLLNAVSVIHEEAKMNQRIDQYYSQEEQTPSRISYRNLTPASMKESLTTAIRK